MCSSLAAMVLCAAASIPDGGATLADSEPSVVIAADLHRWLNDPAAERLLLQHLDAEARKLGREEKSLGKPSDVEDLLRLQVAKNLEDKRALASDGGLLPMTSVELREEVIDYEAF